MPCPGPCTPLHVGVDLQCGTHTANLYWEEREGVEFYLAYSSSSLGLVLLCNSTNSTCQFSDLHCGETYEFSVTAYSNGCYSEASSIVEIQAGMAPHYQFGDWLIDWVSSWIHDRLTGLLSPLLSVMSISYPLCKDIDGVIFMTILLTKHFFVHFIYWWLISLICFLRVSEL